jgi:YegS/Rv2252/BmrU family lipid kinase
MDPLKTLLVVNPAAGHGRGKKVFARLEPRLREAFPGLDVRFSEYAGHAVEIGREAARAGVDRLLALGGDGTPYELINGLYADGRPARLPEIGQIPAGTGNSFLRDFDVTTPDEALERILAGRRRKADLVEFTSCDDRSSGTPVRRFALNIIGVGLIADILELTNRRLKFLGSAGYSLAVLIRLIRGMSNRVSIEADGRRLDVADSALVVSNSKYTGGKMKIAPPADTSDGQADIVLFNGVNRREILAIFSGVFSGKHTAHPKVDLLRGASISVESDPPLRLMADGELIGWTPLRLKVLPGELDILA